MNSLEQNNTQYGVDVWGHNSNIWKSWGYTRPLNSFSDHIHCQPDVITDMYRNFLEPSFTLTVYRRKNNSRHSPGEGLFSVVLILQWSHPCEFTAHPSGQRSKQEIWGDELEPTGTGSTITHSLSRVNFNWALIWGTRLCYTQTPPPSPEACKLRPIHDCDLPEGMMGQHFLKCDGCLSGDPGMIFLSLWVRLLPSSPWVW